MQRIFKYIFSFSIFFIILGCSMVKAQNISVDEVINHMNNNNLLKDNEYFRLFSNVLKVNDNNDITDFSYVVSKVENNININVVLTDSRSNIIEKNLVFSVNGDIINYSNGNAIDSLESRIATVMFSQLIYSIGGARGYSKDILIDWMNQIDLEKVTAEDGINWSYENVTYKITKNGSDYEYEIAVPKSFNVNINKITNKLPDSRKVIVSNLKASHNSVSMTVEAPNYLSEMCNIYRRNDKNQYIKVGQVSCDNGTFVDDKLKDETTYYYQVTVENMIMCADDIEITTEKAPVTGTFIGIGAVILLLMGFSCYVIYKKKMPIWKI